jgi:hypothetical protein
MKYIILMLCLSVVPVMAQNVPTPHQAVSFNMKADKVKWKMQGTDGNSSGIIAEFTPEGQSLKAWTEMMAQQITFTKLSLQDHVKAWRKMIEKADRNVEITADSKGGVMIMTYKSKLFNEYSIRKFMKGSDGVYAFAYHVRLAQFKEERAKLWRSILEQSELIKNPAKK